MSQKNSHDHECIPPKFIPVKSTGSTLRLIARGFSFAAKIKQKLRILAAELGFYYFVNAAIVSLLVSIAIAALKQPFQEHEHFVQSIANAVAILSTATALVLTLYFLIIKQQTIYVVDFACHKPGDHRKCRGQLLEYFGKRSQAYSDDHIDFQRKVYLKSGLGEDTYLSPFIFHDPPIKPSMKMARLEAEEVIIGAMDNLFAKTRLKPQDIDILIVNCSCFSPTPSLASMVVNHYKLRSNICSLNLGGMGCSVGAVAVDLAKHLLRSFRNSNAVVVSTENITFNWYCGKNRSMLVPNCLFRVGAAAVLLSNKNADRRRAKYQLHCTVRTHTAADDKAYRSIYQEEDDEGIVGVSLSKYIMKAAADAVRENMTNLGPLVLPYSEQFRFLTNFLSRKIFRSAKEAYIPNFKLAFDHFLIHPGGRGVLDEIQKKLGLSDCHMEASRMTLHRFGNTSSSSIWYELAYLEAKERVKKGDQLWLMGLGAGFKCSSVVLKALRTVKKPSMNPWLEDIHKYPAKIVIDKTDLIRSEKLLYRTSSGSLFDCMKGERVEESMYEAADEDLYEAAKYSRESIGVCHP